MCVLVVGFSGLCGCCLVGGVVGFFVGLVVGFVYEDLVVGVDELI